MTTVASALSQQAPAHATTGSCDQRRMRPHLGRGVRQPGALRAALLDALVDGAEVGHLGVAVRVQQNVGRLDVAAREAQGGSRVSEWPVSPENVLAQSSSASEGSSSLVLVPYRWIICGRRPCKYSSARATPSAICTRCRQGSGSGRMQPAGTLQASRSLSVPPGHSSSTRQRCGPSTDRASRRQMFGCRTCGPR